MFSVADENSCSSADAVWANCEQNVQTPLVMHSPHLASTAPRDQKKMTPEDSYMAAYSMPTEQLPSHPVLPPQQQQEHQPQAAMDYKCVPRTSCLMRFHESVFFSVLIEIKMKYCLAAPRSPGC